MRLISAKEDIGEGHLADAMGAVTDIFNEMEARRNGEDIKAKLRNKAINGGTITRAKLGYLNIPVEQEGRLYNSIGLDPNALSSCATLGSFMRPATTPSTSCAQLWRTWS